MTLGKVLKVIVVMRSLFIDRTIVKGYNENVYTEDGKVSDLSTMKSISDFYPEFEANCLLRELFIEKNRSCSLLDDALTVHHVLQFVSNSFFSQSIHFYSAGRQRAKLSKYCVRML